MWLSMANHLSQVLLAPKYSGLWKKTSGISEVDEMFPQTRKIVKQEEPSTTEK